MRLIRFRRLSRPVTKVDVCGTEVHIQWWEVASDQAELDAKLNGEMAEVWMPARAWPVRLWRRFFPLKGVEVELSA